MLTQTAAAIATILGLTSSWMIGHHHRAGWIVSIACCATWTAVNLNIHLWAGAASAVIAAAISTRNWTAWSKPTKP